MLFVGVILSFEFKNVTLSDRYETQNGIIAEEAAQLEQTEEGNDAFRKVGYYQYVGDDNKIYRVDYVADANGFQPTVCLVFLFEVNLKRMNQIS